MREPNPKLLDLLNAAVRTRIKDRAGNTIISQHDILGQPVLLVPPNGKVLVLHADNFTINQSQGDFLSISITARIMSHTSIEGVLVNTLPEDVSVEVAPAPVKQKRIIGSI